MTICVLFVVVLHYWPCSTLACRLWSNWITSLHIFAHSSTPSIVKSSQWSVRMAVCQVFKENTCLSTWWFAQTSHPSVHTAVFASHEIKYQSMNHSVHTSWFPIASWKRTARLLFIFYSMSIWKCIIYLRKYRKLLSLGSTCLLFYCTSIYRIMKLWSGVASCALN